MFVCSDCGNEFLKWQGQCSFCREWNTLKEVKEEKKQQNGNSQIAGIPQELRGISENIEVKNILTTTSPELNTLLSGGIVEGSILLLSWEPWIGKSTLTLQLCSWIGKEKVCYVSAEETYSQIASRAHRLWVKWTNISILAESNLENIFETIKGQDFSLVILDSISVITSDNASGVSWSLNQIRYIGEKLQEFAKTTDTAVIIIGHITKDGSIAGPKTLEHLVDTVLYFEGERYEDIRILRSLKNRFGSTGEIAVFKMLEDGLHDIKDIGLELVSQWSEPLLWAALSMTVEGSRAMLVECEALTNYTKFGYPKRSSRGINTSKLDMIIAILGKYTSVKLDSQDVYSNITRGLRIDDPGIDLALVAAIISSKSGKKIARDTIYIGEVSLTGKIKSVQNLEKRLKEAEKIGVKKALIPNGEISYKGKIEIHKIQSVTEIEKFI